MGDDALSPARAANAELAAPSVDIGRAPSSPWRLSAREWVDAFKRAFKSFLADDATGLSAQVAFSSLLAFFPAMVFLVGLLDLFGAYDALKEFLAPVAPGDVLTTIDTLQKDTSTGVLRRCIRRRCHRRDLGGKRCDERGDQVRQPRV